MLNVAAPHHPLLTEMQQMNGHQLMLMISYCSWMGEVRALQQSAQRVMGLGIKALCTPTEQAPNDPLRINTLSPRELYTLLHSFAFMQLTIDIKYLHMAHMAVERCSWMYRKADAMKMMFILQRLQHMPPALSTTWPIQGRLLQVR